MADRNPQKEPKSLPPDKFYRLRIYLTALPQASSWKRSGRMEKRGEKGGEEKKKRGKGRESGGRTGRRVWYSTVGFNVPLDSL